MVRMLVPSSIAYRTSIAAMNATLPLNTCYQLQCTFLCIALLLFASNSFAQVPTDASIQERSIITDSTEQAPLLLQPKASSPTGRAPGLSSPIQKTASPKANRPKTSVPSITTETLPSPKQPIQSSKQLNSWTIPNEQHAWARFDLGAWRELQVRTNSFDENGLLIGQTTTLRRETLVSKSLSDFRLRVESIVQVEGKELPTAVQEVTLQLVNDSVVSPAVIRELDTTTINRHGQAVPCAIWELETPIDQGKRFEQIYYSSERSPYVLRRVRRDEINGQIVSQLETRLTQDGLPVLIGDQLESGHHLVTTHKLASGGRRDRFELQTDAVPGGLVMSSEAEYRQTGVVARWTTTTLMQAGSPSVNRVIDSLRERFRSRIESAPIQPTPRPMIPQEQFQTRPAPERPQQRPQKRTQQDPRNRPNESNDREEDRRRRPPKENEENPEEEEQPRRLLRLLRRAEAAMQNSEDANVEL